MAWRPYGHLIEGELDNTQRGRVTGWLSFVGVSERVTFDLRGDFHRDIRGAKIRLKNPQPVEDSPEVRDYMQGFAMHQTGAVGDMTAGLPPRDYVAYPYLEWYSEQNDRVVLELRPEQVELIGTPFPSETEEPWSMAKQVETLRRFFRPLGSDSEK